jgi:TonB family protein
MRNFEENKIIKMRTLFIIFLLTNFISVLHAGNTYDLKLVLQFIETKEKISGCEVTITDENGELKSVISNENGTVIFQGLKEDNFKITVKSNTPLIKDLTSEFYASKAKIQERTIFLYPTPLFEQQLIEKEDALYGNTENILDFSKTNDQSKTCDSTNSHNASFKDSLKDLYRFISREVRYPQESIENGEQGKVYISFIVEKNGTVSHVRVVKGVSQAIDYEAKRVVRSMPKWNPATCNGEPERAYYYLPINFTMQ